MPLCPPAPDARSHRCEHQERACMRSSPTMLAARLRSADDLRIEDVPTPTPGPGEVLVEVGANTICGTDLRIVHGTKTSYVRLPVVIGHEVAGRVAEVGAGVSGYRPDDRVALL